MTHCIRFTIFCMAACTILSLGVVDSVWSEDRVWRVAGQDAVLDDRAVRAGIADVKAALATVGLTVSSPGQSTEKINMISLNVQTLDLDAPENFTVQDREFVSESAYAIKSHSGDARTLSITAASPLGLAYGLFHVADRIRVLKAVPDAQESVAPALPYRFILGRAPVENSLAGPDPSENNLRIAEQAFEESLVQTLKQGYNFIILHGTEDCVPWEVEAYKKRSERYRKYMERFIKTAHAYHLRILLMGDEFIYHPELLERFKATTSVKDDAFWKAYQSKYRSLMSALPELDGVATRVGELIPRYDFRSIDLIHSEEDEPNPRIEERYRRFIKSMQEVVVEEFGKFYFHRTWVVNVHEQHSIPDVYMNTFTEDVPVENFFSSIKLTSGDQWYHYEPYNATFGLTPHTTVAQGEIFSGYQGGGTYIDYPARYFQAAMEWAADRGTKGQLANLGPDQLSAHAISYVFSRLGWTPRADAETLTEDWAAATFGREVRSEIAEIFLLGSLAVRDGLYIRQPGLHNWSPIRHVRTNAFVQRGNPLWDKGKAHDRFLKDIYLECKPWVPETISELNRGVETSERMLTLFANCENRITDREKAKALERLLLHGRAAIQLNRDYVEGFLRYFRYREAPTTENKAALAVVLERVRTSATNYEANYNYYVLLGVSAFVELAGRALENLEEAERVLREAPTAEGVQKMFADARSASAKRLREHPDALHIATWEGTVDGRDLVLIQGDTFRVEHIADDGISSTQLTEHNKIPRDRDCEIVVKPLEVRGTVYLSEQPSAANEYTTTLYVEDPAVGQAVIRFDLYAIER